jgi:signal transduction histidine kinase
VITGKLQLDFRPIELAPLIEAAIDAIRPKADAKAISIHKLLAPANAIVTGDATRLQQIVWNLLSNAVKFTPGGGQLTVELRCAGRDAEIRVADTGEGISAEFLPHVFDRFRQADSSYTRRHSGLGLGLAIASHLVELHGGTIEAHSSGEGQGSTFTVRIPLAARRGENRAEYERGSRAGCDLSETFPSLTDIRILVVDDDADTRDMLAAVLQMYGAKVEKWAQFRYFIVVL